MKILKWKTLILTCFVCLVPILFGVAVWDSLPQQVPIHFNIHNQPDNFASKAFAVFGLPGLMALLQVICCLIFDLNAHYHGPREKFERVVKWILPVMNILLQAATLAVALGKNVDIRIVATGIVGVLLVVLGNYIPKFDEIKPFKKADTEKARKIHRFIGFETVIMGLLFLVSLFLPPICSLICIFLLIPYALLAIVYGIVVANKK